MKEPFTRLDTRNVDDYIEHMEQKIASQPNAGEARYLQDLRYLYRKEEILTRARQRLMSAHNPNESATSTGRSPETNTVWSEHSTIFSQPPHPERRKGFAWTKLATALAAALLLLAALFGTSQFFKGQSSRTAGPGHKGGTTPATASATPASTVLFSDPLTQNTHNWTIDNQHFFKNGAYHVDNLANNASSTILQQVTFAPPWSYSLTMTQIQGDTTSPANAFGMMFAYTQANNHTEHLYTFGPGGDELTLYRYDNSETYPWKELWSSASQKHLAQAFHSQLGQTNTLKVTATVNTLTLIVNNKMIGTVDGIKLSGGQFGMFVSLKGTEVAFQNLLITRP